MSVSYRVNYIDFTESGIKVKFVPNEDSLEVEISKENIEKFFDILRKNKYNTERLYIDTVFKKYGNSRDALTINIPNESGIGTSPSKWIECNFINNDSQHSQETVHSTNTIEFGVYKEKSLCWTKIGKIGNNDLCLCDSFVEKRKLDNSSNNYCTSETSKFLKSFYDEAFLPSEKGKLINHPLLKDFVFLLNTEEFCKYEVNIKKTESPWWLRSRGYETYAAYVDHDSVYSVGCCDYDGVYGIRPAIILKNL